jgi:hypothetical protein
MAEQSDVDIRAVFGFATGLVATGAVIAAAVWLLFGYFAGRDARGNTREYPLAITEETRLPPEPRLQINPREDLREMRAQEDQILHSYQWVDRSAGVVRIPIDRAMRLTLERGLPARANGKAEQK